MSEPTEVAGPRRRLLALIAGAAVLVLVVVAVVWSRAGGVSADPTAPGGSATAAPGPTDSVAPGPDPVSSTGSGPGATSPSQGSGAQVGAVPVPPLGDIPPVVGDGSAPLAPRDGVAVRLVSVTAVTTAGTGPGEVSGAGLAVTVEVTNRTSDAVDLTSSDVTVYIGTDGTPAATVTTDPSSSPFPDQVKPGAAAQGTFVFAAPNDGGTLVAVQVSLGVSLAPVVFQTAVGS